jgi:Methyltransferase FkbM domain
LHDRSELLPEREFEDFEVRVQVIDNLPSLQNVSPTFVKIDVEGFEFQAISGMKALLKRVRPVIAIECPTEELVKLLETMDYRMFDFFGGSTFPLYTGIFNTLAVPYGFPDYERLFLTDRDFVFLFFDYLNQQKFSEI